MNRKKSKQKAAKAIRIKEDGKVTRIVPATKNVKAEVKPKSRGGINLIMEMAFDEETNDD